MRLHLTLLILAVIPAAPAADLDFGLTGIAPFETARMSIFCSDDASRIQPEPCEVTFEFHDIRGNILKKSTLTFDAGTGGSFDLTPADVGIGGSRLEIIPCILVGRGAVFPSYQVFDNFSQRSRIFSNWTQPPEPAGGEIHFGSFGLTAFDTLRLNALCPAGDATRTSAPCDVTFIFHDTRGRILKQITRTLDPGAAGYLDLRAAEAGLNVRRGEIIPCVRVGNGAVVATVETIDNLTGVTTVMAHPAPLTTP
jgi:hypothetical protein